MRRTFHLKANGALQLTLLRNRADYMAWKRQQQPDFFPDDAPFYPCMVYVRVWYDGTDEAQFASLDDVAKDAQTLRSAYCALLGVHSQTVADASVQTTKAHPQYVQRKRTKNWKAPTDAI